MKDFVAIVALGLVASIPACSRSGPEEPRAQTGAAREAILPGLPITLRVKQRSTTPVPGSDGRLVVTVDDITRGQVMVTVAGLDESRQTGPVSMKRGDLLDFRFHEATYRFELAGLDNSLLGEDHATIVISGREADPRSEAEKIEFLLAAIAAMRGCTFTRNGVEHDPGDAARHLRTKLEAASPPVRTAEEFISGIATRSSWSGDPYLVRRTDGTTQKLADLLRSLIRSPETAR